MRDVRGEFHGIDGKFDVHIALDLATTGRIREFLHGFRDHRKTVVVEPIDQWPDRGVFLILDESGIVEGTDQFSFGLILFQQPSVIDIKSERPRRGVKVGAIDEKSNPISILHIRFHNFQLYEMLVRYGNLISSKPNEFKHSIRYLFYFQFDEK